MSLVEESPNENSNDDVKAVPTLDELHAFHQNVMDNPEEDEDDDDEDEDKHDSDDSDEDDSADDSDDDSDEDEDDDDDSADDDKEDEEDDDEEESEDDDEDVADDEAEEEDEEEPELDTDINKNGEGKVAIRDEDGETFYFNSIEEVPEDFIPLNNREMMLASKQFAKNEIERDATSKEREAERVERENAKKVADVKTGWENDIKALVKSGDLPKDEKERTKVINRVYKFMGERLKEGKSIASFEDNYSIMQRREEREKRKEQAVKDKKSKGGKVFGSGGGVGASKSHARGGVLPGVPQGTSLDMIHNKYS